MTFRDSHVYGFRDLGPATAIGQNAYIVHLPPRCPDVVRIIGAELNAQNWNPYVVGTYFLSVGLDPGGRYCKTAGFPATQVGGYSGLQGLALLPIIPIEYGGDQSKARHFSPGYLYDRTAGDCIVVDLAYGGGGDFYLRVEWEAEERYAWDLDTHLLMHFDEWQGTDTDLCAWPHLTNILGDGRFSTEQAKFGRASFKPATTSAGVIRIWYANDLNLQWGDWTWEAFVRPADHDNNKIILTQGDGYSPVMLKQAGNTFEFRASVSGTNWDVIQSMGSAPVDTWVHLAAVRSGSEIKLYRDGVQQGATITSVTHLHSSGADWFIGAAGTSMVEPFRGYIDEVRFSKVARDPASFPPTEAYPS
ncbi:MAG: hypothetical protein K0R61_59 [Microvirga sp.]|jgi:hypothetical protein|nr:hypothetical protein [Microvirga sp.]MDF2969609.1 hypothetical protein [Microvirga sp.]